MHVKTQSTKITGTDHLLSWNTYPFSGFRILLLKATSSPCNNVRNYQEFLHFVTGNKYKFTYLTFLIDVSFFSFSFKGMHETRVNLANAHHQQRGRRYVACILLFLWQILKSRNEGKKFRPICCVAMLSLNTRKIIAVKYTTFYAVTKRI